MEKRGLSVAKPTELIVMPFGILTPVDQRNHVLDGGRWGCSPQGLSFRANSKFGQQYRSLKKVLVLFFNAFLFDFIHNSKIKILYLT